MADLLDRVQGVGDRPKLPVHQFRAAVYEYALGQLTRQQIATAFDLQGDEATQAGELADLVDAASTAIAKLSTCIAIENVLMLAEIPELGLYDTKQEIATRLGL